MSREQPFKNQLWGRGYFTELEPGDGTHYEFLIMRYDRSNLLCAAVSHGSGSALFAGYTYRVTSVLDCLERMEGAAKEEEIYQEFGQIDHYLGYMTERGHSDCNSWTARAACMAMGEFLSKESL